jgi:hypothetical protein
VRCCRPVTVRAWRRLFFWAATTPIVPCNASRMGVPVRPRVPGDVFEWGHDIVRGTEQYMFRVRHTDATGVAYLSTRCVRCESTRYTIRLPSRILLDFRGFRRRFRHRGRRADACARTPDLGGYVAQLSPVGEIDNAEHCRQAQSEKNRSGVMARRAPAQVAGGVPRG